MFIVLFGAMGAVSKGVIAEGTRWEMAWRVYDSGQPGPTVLVVGGVHGNEPAGASAAGQIQHWPVKRGRLIVVPRADGPGTFLLTAAGNSTAVVGVPETARVAPATFAKCVLMAACFE